MHIRVDATRVYRVICRFNTRSAEQHACSACLRAVSALAFLQCALPQELIDDFEGGIQRDVHQQSFTSGGQTINTLSTLRTVADPREHSAKRPQLETLIDSSSSG